MQLSFALSAFHVWAGFPRNPESLALGPHALSEGDVHLLSLARKPLILALVPDVPWQARLSDAEG